MLALGGTAHPTHPTAPPAGTGRSERGQVSRCSGRRGRRCSPCSCSRSRLRWSAKAPGSSRAQTEPIPSLLPPPYFNPPSQLPPQPPTALRACARGEKVPGWEEPTFQPASPGGTAARGSQPANLSSLLPPRSHSLSRSVSPGPPGGASSRGFPAGSPRSSAGSGHSPGAAARQRCLRRSGPAAPLCTSRLRAAPNRAEPRRTAPLPAAALRPLPAAQSRGTGLTGTCPEGGRGTKEERMKKWGGGWREGSAAAGWI